MFPKMRFICVLAVLVFLSSGTCYSAGPDPEGNYYISTKYPDAGYDGNIKEWTITISYLGLINTDDTVKDVLTDTVSLNLLTANKESIAGYFKQGASLPAGNYKQVRITQGPPSSMTGWIKLSDDEYIYTVDADPNYAVTDSVATAEASAGSITIDTGSVTGDVPENPTGYVTVEEGNSYELRIFWYAIGLESGNGVGLVSNESEGFIEGMLCEQYILHNNTTGEDQYFSGD